MHAQATDYRCGDATVRVYKDTGIETNGLQFNHGDIRFDAHGWVTAGHWQRSAGYIDGKHAITLKETRFAMRDGQLMTAVETAPSSPEDAAKVRARDYSHPFPPAAPASWPFGKTRRDGRIRTSAADCEVAPEGVQMASDLSWADLLAHLFGG